MLNKFDDLGGDKYLHYRLPAARMPFVNRYKPSIVIFS